MKNSKINNILNETNGKAGFSDFLVLVFVISILVIDFLPYFKSMEIINPQFLYLSILNVIIGVYFYFNTSLISYTLFPLLKQSYVTKLYVAFIFFCAVSIFSAKNISLVLTKFTEILIVLCLFINLCVLLKGKLNLLYKIAFIVSIAAFIQSWQQLYNFIIIPKHASVLNLLGEMKGNTGNINILAASLTVKVPFIIFGISHFKNYKKLLLLAALFSATSVIFLTAARTSLLNLFLIFSAYSIFLFREFSFKKSTIIKILYIIIPVAISFIFSNSIFEKSKDKERYTSLENRIEKISTNDASSQARLVYWNNALKISRKNPVTGIGLGNYRIESIPYELTTSDDSIVSLHTHNDFLEIMAETGILNSLIYLSLFIFILIINLRNILKSTSKKIRSTAILTLMILIVYGVDSFFNFPMYRPTMQIFFSLLLALTVLNNAEKQADQDAIDTSSFKSAFLTVIVIAIITSYSAYIIYKASNLEYLIVSDDISMNDKGLLNGDEVLQKMPMYPNVFQSSESFYEYAGIYYVREKKYDKALKCFSKAKIINGYSGRIEFYKQVISKNKGNIDSAYIYAKQAFYLRPRNYDLFKTAITYAITKKDTLEILKQHKLFSQYRPMSETWNTVSNGLKSAGYSNKNLLAIVESGLKKFPEDTILLKKKKLLLISNYNENSNSEKILKHKNDLLIADYITEGQKFEEQKKMDKALESYEKALKIDSKNIYACQNIGFYYLKTAKSKKAINYLLNALKYPGLNDGKTEYFLAICYLEVGDKTNACKYLNRSKGKNYSNAQPLIVNVCK